MASLTAITMRLSLDSSLIGRTAAFRKFFNAHVRAENQLLYYRSLPTCCSSRSFCTHTKAVTYSTLPERLPPEIMRNIGMSAHVDAGKTSITERLLFYTGRIKEIHEVQPKDGSVGAKMDFMELEKEKGITIQAAATYCEWKHSEKPYHINIIDTPGHVDFTSEVERSLRVLDGAILVLCAVSGVQSQTITVDRQMKKFRIARILLVNKMDREGADCDLVLKTVKEKLRINAALLQVPIGLAHDFRGAVDIVNRVAYYFEGEHGENIIDTKEIPPELEDIVEEKRSQLFEALADVDDEFAELYLDSEQNCTAEVIESCVRRATLRQTFCPMLIGSAKTNKCNQLLLDGICKYLPSPADITCEALDPQTEENITMNVADPRAPFCGFVFKLQEYPGVGQVTLLRIYQGMLKKNAIILDAETKKKYMVKKLMRMHADEAKEIASAGAGDIVSVTGVDCTSGITLTDGRSKYMLAKLSVPEPVVSLSVNSGTGVVFNKAVARFQREDPTFRVSLDEESGDTIILGMGELQLELYVERLKREYGVIIQTGQPAVSYIETITSKAFFDYTYEKVALNFLNLATHPDAAEYIERMGPSGASFGEQVGDEGTDAFSKTEKDRTTLQQSDFIVGNPVNNIKKPRRLYARVKGYLEPMSEEERIQSEAQGESFSVEKSELMEGNTMNDKLFKAFYEGVEHCFRSGPISGFKSTGIKLVLTACFTEEGSTYPQGFTETAKGVIRGYYQQANPVILEPVMHVHVVCPSEFQNAAVSTLTKRNSVPHEVSNMGGAVNIEAFVRLKNMFGYISSLRSVTQGQGHYQMEFRSYEPMITDEQMALEEAYKEKSFLFK